MNQRCFILLAILAAVPVLAQPASARQTGTPNSGAWSGILVYSSCNADEVFNESPKCFRAAPGARLAHYDYVPNELAEKVIAAHKAAHGEQLVEEEA